MTPADVIEQLLDHIRTLFYKNEPERFYQQRKQLIYTLTQPSHWLHQRALHTTPLKYQQLITDIIDDISKHANPQINQLYLPAYLLKCIQQYLIHHGDALYDQLKHVRNSIDFIIHSIDPEALSTNRHNAHFIESMQQLHQITKPRESSKSDHKQMTLF
jgi:hypothetical protein